MTTVRRQLSLALLLLGLVLAAPALASQVKARNLHDLVAAAGTVFAGSVEAVEFDRIHGMPVTRVTFRVGDGLRGTSGEVLTLTFPGGMQPNGLPYRISGLVPFRPGERLVLLAYPASPIGLTSPVGLYQGRFDLREGPAGLQSVVAHGLRPGDLAGPVELIDAGRKMPAGATAVSPPAASASTAQALPLPAPAGTVSFLYTDFMDTLRELVAADDAARLRHGAPTPVGTAPSGSPGCGTGSLCGTVSTQQPAERQR